MLSTTFLHTYKGEQLCIIHSNSLSSMRKWIRINISNNSVHWFREYLWFQREKENYLTSSSFKFRFISMQNSRIRFTCFRIFIDTINKYLSQFATLFWPKATLYFRTIPWLLVRLIHRNPLDFIIFYSMLYYLYTWCGWKIQTFSIAYNVTVILLCVRICIVWYFMEICKVWVQYIKKLTCR